MPQLIQKLDILEKEITHALLFLKMPQLKQRLHELETLMQSPNFWNDAKEAQKISQEQGGLMQKITAWESLQKNLMDSKELLEVLPAEEGTADFEEQQHTVDDLERRYQSLEIQLYLSGKHDECPTIMSFHAGAGGTDAQDWAEMLLRMYMRYADAKNWKTTLLEKSEGETAGIKSASLRIEGEFTYGFLKEEAGVHRLVRLSPFNIKHTRETSFCLIEVTPEIEEIDLKIAEDDLKIDVFRAGGHGGQSVNTTDSAVRITHLPTGIVAKCQNERSQLQNRQQAMKSLLSKLLVLQEKTRIKELRDLKGEHIEGAWGNQIRSYVLHPYQMVKDHRTGVEVRNIQPVLDGELDKFIDAEIFQFEGK